MSIGHAQITIKHHTKFELGGTSMHKSFGHGNGDVLVTISRFSDFRVKSVKLVFGFGRTHSYIWNHVYKSR